MTGQAGELPLGPQALAALPVRIDQILSDTGKTLTATGELDGEQVVVKVLASGDPFWRARLRHEIAVYRRFRATPPPVRVPRLAGTDGRTWLALEFLPGHPLGTARYLTRASAPDQIAAVLSAVRALSRWDPPADAFGHVPDYRERIGRYHAAGFLSGADHDDLAILLDRCGDHREFCHGDLIPANIWLTAGDASCALLDWEYAGWYLPGYDLAMLAVLAGGAVPGLHEVISDLITADDTTAAFCVNLAAVLTRELRLHRELDTADPARARLPAIEASWARARYLIRRVAASG